ncbi:anaphase promoting complex subunit DOC1 [Aspergillus saccharolyticus JOP 1030-1]|uniref:Galactose-binding like protein n=1 Tax=Aspergillus saccharolyticus JOP 1030-1 TaxID=1450539 RepID=A0A318ZP86_9EURO|nr:galactose-binding like protein [Aspergillus saccharolyticus JOP 1030-1]PYH45720.1 galactose-binding like protein [Aspergillus saccharolyticus JOP 1030-1]
MPRHHHILRRNHNQPDTSSPTDSQHQQYQQRQQQQQPPPAPQRSSTHRTRLGQHPRPPHQHHDSPTSQFRTPPSRSGFPIPRLHPSSGPIDDPTHPLHSHQQAQQQAHQQQHQQRHQHPAAAAAQVALFSLFGRGVHGRGHGDAQRHRGHPPHDRTGHEDEEDEEGEDDEEEEDDLDDSMQQHHHQYPSHRRQRRRHDPRGIGEVGQFSDEDPTGDVSDEDEEFAGDDENDVVIGNDGVEEDEEEDEEVLEEGEEDEDMLADADVDGDEEMMGERDKSPTPLPVNLREISSLASWTVSTHKPGCGVGALRHPSPTQYWQSDGPQPHTLTLHFFKLVAVVRIRVYLDFEMDESYTPTKMVFLAGMGGNDLVEFATWEGEGPCGWVDVELEGVGGRNTVHAHAYGERRRGAGAAGATRKRKMMMSGWKGAVRTRSQRKGVKGTITSRRGGAAAAAGVTGKANKGKGRDLGDGNGNDDDVMMVDQDEHEHEHEDTDEDLHEDAGEYMADQVDEEDDEEYDDDNDQYAGNVLKAMVIQMKVTENHQNGKDTHVRGFQVFARDEERRRLANAPSASADGRVRRHSARRSLRGSTHDEMTEGGLGAGSAGREHAVAEAERAVKGVVTSLEEPDWMGEPIIR